MPSRPGAHLISLLVVLALLGACSEGAGDEAPVSDCALPTAIDMPAADLPADFPWPSDVTLAAAQLEKKFISLEGFSKLSVEDLFESSKPALTTKGFDIINTDYEGFEAELYFAKGDSLAGILSMREGPCDGYVKVNVIYDPLETAAGRKAVRKTRELSGEG